MDNNYENNFTSASEKNADGVIQIGKPLEPDTTNPASSAAQAEQQPPVNPQTTYGADPIYRSYGAPRQTPTEQIPHTSSIPSREWASPAGHSKNKTKGKNKASSGFVAALICVALILATAAGFLGGYVAKRSGASQNGTGSNAPLSTQAGSKNTISDNEAVTVPSGDGTTVSAADAAADSVVVITTEVTATSAFYGNYITSGAGSGVVIDSENGYIITCAHVIEGASKITVKLSNEEEYLATVIGTDSKTDIAIIKIEADGLTSANIGDSEELVVGEDVIAIGNPLGTLGGTVSDGIISALNREITIDGQKYSLLQTSASINPGNSGGGLFDMYGNLIGVVNAKSSGTTSSGTTIEGLGFAIPINSAIEVANELISNGYVSGRVQLGIYVYEVADTNDYYGLRSSKYSSLINYVTDYGVYFTEYQDNQSGDLTFGDRIVAIDGSTVSSMSDISNILEEYSVGDTIDVTVARLDKDTSRSRMVDVSMTLVEYVPSSTDE